MECKEIKMLNAGPNDNYQPGQVIRVDKVRADVLVSSGHAEYYVQKLEAKLEVKPEPQSEAAKSDGKKVNQNGTKANNSSKYRANQPVRGKITP